MNPETVLGLVISSLSIVIAVISLIKSFATSRESKQFKKIAVEDSCLNNIVAARQRYSEFSEKVISLDERDERKKAILLSYHKERVEEYLNALDLASDRYLNGYIDEASFKRNFKELVSQCQESKEVMNIISDQTKNKYPALKKVFVEYSQ